ncbi:MAG: ribosome-associated translation inhibitor RaiA [Mycobacteriales bacterium]
MDIAVTGRNVEVPSHYRQRVTEKLGRLERYDQKLIRIDVELLHEPNPRQAAACQRVEITCRSRGPVIRSEACAETFYAAFDVAMGKLANRLRRLADRRRVHHGARTPTSVAAATAGAVDGDREAVAATATVAVDDQTDEVGPGKVVREKQHSAIPMSIEQALFEMELVGHDFFLFADADSGAPSVVYRRKGYDYGVIRLIT